MQGHRVIVGCYTMDLYCDVVNPPPDHTDPIHGRGFAQFTGQTAGECRKKARRAGWKIDADLGTALCPEHRGDLATIRGVGDR